MGGAGLLPTQASIGQAAYYSYSPSSRITFPIDGIIVFVHFPGDVTNVSKREIEYDVLPSYPGMGKLRNVPIAVGVHGLLDDDEVVLKPATRAVAKMTSPNVEQDPLSTDGDRVIVQFINGSFANPVITGVLNHPQRGLTDLGEPESTIPQLKGKMELLTKGAAGSPGYAFGTGATGSTAAELTHKQGERYRHMKFNGTHVAVDANGDLFVNFKEHPDPDKGLPAGAVDKKIVVQNEGMDLLRIEKDGANYKLVIGEALSANILVQVGDGAKKVANADDLQTLYASLKSVFDAHTHILAIAAAAGAGGTGTAAAPATPAPAWDTAINSNKLKIPANT